MDAIQHANIIADADLIVSQWEVNKDVDDVTDLTKAFFKNIRAITPPLVDEDAATDHMQAYFHLVEKDDSWRTFGAVDPSLLVVYLAFYMFATKRVTLHPDIAGTDDWVWYSTTYQNIILGKPNPNRIVATSNGVVVNNERAT